MTWFIVVQLLRPRRRSLVHRMSDFVTMPLETQSKPTPGRPPTAAAGERLGRLDQFRQDLGIANISVSAERLIMGSLLGAGLLGLVTATATGIPLLILVGVIVPVVMRMVISRRLAARRRAFEEQLPDNLQVLASAMRAGHSLAGALAVVVEDAPEPAKSEFRRVIADEQLGVSLEDSLGVVVRRMQSDDLDQVALLAALQHETGGNTAEVLERVTQTIRQRDDVRRMVRGLTAQGRISRWVVSALPVVLLAVIAVVNPGYLTPLFTKTAGQVMLAAGVAMVVTGSLAIKRIVDIKV
jgi:tight adherence protein B